MKKQGNFKKMFRLICQVTSKEFWKSCEKTRSTFWRNNNISEIFWEDFMQNLGRFCITSTKKWRNLKYVLEDFEQKCVMRLGKSAKLLRKLEKMFSILRYINCKNFEETYSRFLKKSLKITKEKEKVVRNLKNCEDSLIECWISFDQVGRNF